MKTKKVVKKKFGDIVGVSTAPSAASKGIFPEIEENA